MEDSESSAAPLKREWMEAQGREKSQLGKRTQLSEQLPPFSQSGDFPGASSFHGLFPWGPGAEEGLGPETEASGERGETVTFTELPGKDGVWRIATDGVPGHTDEGHALFSQAPGYGEDGAIVGLIGCLPQGLPAVGHILSSLVHEACQISHTGAVLIVL